MTNFKEVIREEFSNIEADGSGVRNGGIVVNDSIKINKLKGVIEKVDGSIDNSKIDETIKLLAEGYIKISEDSATITITQKGKDNISGPWV